MSPHPIGMSRRTSLALGLSTLCLPAVARAAPRAAVDAIGRPIALKGPAERIVLGFNFEEFTAVAGPAGWDRVVGWSRTFWADWRPAAFRRYLAPIPRLANLPDIGATEDGGLSLEKVLSLRPDLVVLPEWSFSQLAEPVRQLEALGVAVMVIDYNAELLDRTVASTLALGRATGNEERAQALAAIYAEKMGDVRRRAASAGTHPKAYLELGLGGAGVVGNSYANTTMWGRLLDQIGARNIADGHVGKSWGPLSPEYVLTADPDVIFIAGSSWINRPNAVVTGYDAPIELTRARLAPYARRDGWEGLTAIRNGDLNAIEHGLCRALFDYTATQYLAKQLYPAQFADIDPVDELRRYHEHFLPVAFDGTWMARLTPRPA